MQLVHAGKNVSLKDVNENEGVGGEGRGGEERGGEGTGHVDKCLSNPYERNVTRTPRFQIRSEVVLWEGASGRNKVVSCPGGAPPRRGLILTLLVKKIL